MRLVTKQITKDEYNHYHALNSDIAQRAYILEQLLETTEPVIALHYGIHNHNAVKNSDGTYALKFYSNK